MTTTLRKLAGFTVATVLAVGATTSAAYVSGAATSVSPSNPGATDPHVHPGKGPAIPRVLPIVGPNGKPVVDEHGTPLLMDTAPQTGQPSPNGQTVIATNPASASAQTEASQRGVSAPSSIVRPYDDKKYRER